MDPDELSRALSALSTLPADDPVRLRVERVAESFVRDGRKQRQKQERLRRRDADRTVLAASATGAVKRREDAALAMSGASAASRQANQQAGMPPVVPGAVAANGPAGPGTDADPVGTLLRPRRCYVCKQHFTEVSAFYHQLCPPCAAENLARCSARTPLDGRRALVTGGRVKIGF
jgi:hypothetical protein